MRRLYAATWIMVGAMIAVPASPNGPRDAAVRATIEKYFASFNNGDASATAEQWREDAVDINVNGLISGKAQLNERLGTEFKLGVKFLSTRSIVWRLMVRSLGQRGSTP